MKKTLNVSIPYGFGSRLGIAETATYAAKDSVNSLWVWFTGMSRFRTESDLLGKKSVNSLWVWFTLMSALGLEGATYIVSIPYGFGSR